MTLVVDSSGLLAAIDSAQQDHAAARQALEAASGPFLISPFVLAELDYMLLTRFGPEQEMAFLDEVVRGAYRLEPFSSEDVAAARGIIERFTGFVDLSLADASNAVLAERYDTDDILTLDERHFRVLDGPGKRPFRLLPADA